MECPKEIYESEYNMIGACLICSLPLHFLQHGETALHLAAGYGHVEIIKYLQVKGASTDVSDKVNYSTSQLQIVPPKNDNWTFSINNFSKLRTNLNML